MLTALLGLAGPSATRSLIDTVEQIAPGAGSALLVDVIEELQGARSPAGPLGIGSAGVLIWRVAKWPAPTVLVSPAFALLY